MDPRHRLYTQLLIGRQRRRDRDQADEQTARELGFDSPLDLRKEVSRYYAICERCGEEWPTVSHDCRAGAAPSEERRSARVRGKTEELPSVKRAEPLFRAALGRLSRQLPWLERRVERRRGRRFIAAHELRGVVGESVCVYSRQGIGQGAWQAWCEQRGLDPEADAHQLPYDYNAPLEVPADYPPGPEWQLIATHLLSGGDIDGLVEVLHPHPLQVDREKLKKEVTYLFRAAQRVATEVRGGSAGAGKRAPETTADEIRLARHIQTMRGRGFPDEWITEYLKNGGIDPLPVGFHPTQEEVARLAKLNIT